MRRVSICRGLDIMGFEMTFFYTASYNLPMISEVGMLIGL
jgi:hypothetical protein